MLTPSVCCRRQCAAIFWLISCNNQHQLIWCNTFFILVLCLTIIDDVAGFNNERGSFACECLDEEMLATSETSGALTPSGCCSRKCAANFQLISCKFQLLLIRWDTFFILGLSIIDDVGGIDIAVRRHFSSAAQLEAYEETAQCQAALGRGLRVYGCRSFPGVH